MHTFTQAPHTSTGNPRSMPCTRPHLVFRRQQLRLHLLTIRGGALQLSLQLGGSRFLFHELLPHVVCHLRAGEAQRCWV
jgi:hypothetical protein